MDSIESLNKNLIEIKTEIYDQLSLSISQFITEPEGTEYDACQLGFVPDSH